MTPAQRTAINKYIAPNIMDRCYCEGDGGILTRSGLAFVILPVCIHCGKVEPSPLDLPDYTSRTPGDIWDLIRIACKKIHGEGCQLIFETSTPESIAEDIAIKYWIGQGNKKEDAPWLN